MWIYKLSEGAHHFQLAALSVGIKGDTPSSQTGSLVISVLQAEPGPAGQLARGGNRSGWGSRPVKFCHSLLALFFYKILPDSAQLLWKRKEQKQGKLKTRQ